MYLLKKIVIYAIIFAISFLSGGFQMTFGQKVKEARKKLGLSQEKFAAKMGVSFSTINRWERGSFNPSYLAQAQFDSFCKENEIVFDNTSDEK